MKKYLLANWGVAKQGKTSTLNKIVQSLQIRKDFIEKISFADNTDICVIIILKLINKIEITIKIGIESAGDPGSRLDKSLEQFVNNDCDIIICSSRTSGSTVEIIENIAKNSGYELFWFTNMRTDSEEYQNNLNEFSATQIVNFIIDIIVKSNFNVI